MTTRKPWITPTGTARVEFGYPTWFVTPSYAKDTGGESGGTIQGRITCKSPPAQTFPDGIKSCIHSRWPGGTIAWFDLSQIELRVAALLSGDVELMAAYQSPVPVDLHTACAVEFFGEASLGDPAFRTRYRTPAKHIRFGKLYRAGADKLQMTVLKKANIIIDHEFCDREVRARPTRNPELWAWQESVIAEARRVGHVLLPFIGQSRMFMGGEDYDVSEIINMPVQTTAGNALLRLQAYCHHCGPHLNARQPPFLMFINIYDAIGFDCRDDDAVAMATSLVNDAVEFESKWGYWSALCAHYGREIPLVYERTLQAA